jgi:hypothetical protein
LRPIAPLSRSGRTFEITEGGPGWLKILDYIVPTS